MKGKIILSAILGFCAVSLSQVASAGWDPGACPQPHTGPAPCIEAIIGGTAYHFNGTGSHAGEWHGSPVGGDLVFVGASQLGCSGLNLNCSLTLRGQVKKCQDSAGNWRIGVRVNSYNVAGTGCGTITLGGFPWYAKDAAITPHCPFEDDCDSFIPYDPAAVNYTANLGEVDISVFFIPRVTDGHVHNVIFTPGVNASFAFNTPFFDCDETNLGCTVNGLLQFNNGVGDALNVY